MGNNNLNMKIDDGLLRLTFTNMEDEVFAKCRLNPTDINIVKRCEEASANMKKLAEQNNTLDGAIEFNAKIEEQICNVLGYNAKADLFSVLTATSILPNGAIFAEVVLNRIIEVIKPELEKRANKMKASVNKYTKKYHK